ncbi:phosphatase PAP2 family protein [Beijerinckia sp. L45]|uniref:phosphatase PAP2 family protein n=1 Tax=Beijerinckia sp. L45 TaxID=1641855 RepID=UPI00131BB431|nr:phosphatase PAP2 family protein [Beijerinckia sp. L45]
MAGVNAAWALIVLLGAAAAFVMRTLGLTFDWASALLPAAACIVLLIGAAFYRFRRPEPNIATALTGTAQLILFSAVGATLSYAVAAFATPYWDNRFAAWDHGLGLDWIAYLHFVESHPWLATVYGVTYASIRVQLIVATVVLGLTGNRAACRQFVVAVIVAGLVTVTVSAFMPAHSVFTELGLAARDYPGLDLTAAFDPLKPLTDLRTGTLRVVSLTGAEGIIAFPSFHAALGIIFAVAFWRSRWLRWPGLGLNATMIASTPVNGGHYFVDVVAGIAVAIAAVWAARAMDGVARPVARGSGPVACPAALASDSLPA